MKYKLVRLGKTRSYGNFQNANIMLEVELEEGEQYEQVVKQLNEEVERLLDQIIESQHISQIEARKRELLEELDKLENKVYSKRELLSNLATISALIKDLEAKEA
jgi:Mg2+ and Co2+ transporter CorA